VFVSSGKYPIRKSQHFNCKNIIQGALIDTITAEGRTTRRTFAGEVERGVPSFVVGIKELTTDHEDSSVTSCEIEISSPMDEERR